jgi:hypothetical protein
LVLKQKPIESHQDKTEAVKQIKIPFVSWSENHVLANEMTPEPHPKQPFRNVKHLFPIEIYHLKRSFRSDISTFAPCKINFSEHGDVSELYAKKWIIKCSYPNKYPFFIANKSSQQPFGDVCISRTTKNKTSYHDSPLFPLRLITASSCSTNSPAHISGYLLANGDSTKWPKGFNMASDAMCAKSCI